MLGNLFGTKRDDTTYAEPAATSLQPGQVTQGISAGGPVQTVSPAPVMPIRSVPNPMMSGFGSSSHPPVGGVTMDPTRREDLSALSHLDARSTQVLAHAQQETTRIKQSMIMPEQVLFGLLYDEEIYKLLEQFSVDVAKLSRELQSKAVMGSYMGQPTMSDQVKQIFEEAFKNAKDRISTFIAPEDILVVLFSSGLSTAAMLQAQGVQKEAIVEKLEKSPTYAEGRKTVLDKFGVDLTAKAKAGELDPVAGREKEVDRLIHILLRRTKNNPIIIGEAGVGKTAIIEGLAEQIIAGTVPKDLQNKRIIQLDVASLVAGASHRGEFEERLRNIMRDAMAVSGQVILFIDEIHTLIGAGESDSALDASNIIKPNLARGQLQIIGTTTTSEYRKYFEKDKAFARRFQPIVCEEPDEDNAFLMLQVLKPKYEKFHSVIIPDEALRSAVQLSKKYIGERYLPDKAVDLLDEASADVRLQHNDGKREDNTVVKSDIERVVSAWTGIPITKLTEDESAKLLELDKKIHQRLIDQDQAVEAVSEAVRRGRIGLAAANRPIASFIFLGPTGTGKTELAKTLAEILFGRDDAMVRLDMSEYMEKHEVAKLIGAPPGYVGYEEGGQLTEAVRAKPYSIVLLDEVEKAHPDVFNILLQLLEDGRLTDNKGNTISFKNTIVIATSNIGSTDIQEELSKPTKLKEEFDKMYADMQAKVSEDLHKFFRPELLNRFDEIVMFKPLRQEDMQFIAKLGVEKTGKLLKDQGYTLEVTDAALQKLAKDGYDPQYGARPLRRLIQTAIENPIAMLLINKTFVQGDTIQIDYSDQQANFVFTKVAAQSDQPNATSVSPTSQQQPTAQLEQNTVQEEQIPVTSGSSQQQIAPQAASQTIMPSVNDIAAAVPMQEQGQPQAAPVNPVPVPAGAVIGITPGVPQPELIPATPGLAEVPVGILAPAQPAIQPVTPIDQMPPASPVNPAVSAASFSPPAVSAANLLDDTDEETTEFA